MSQKQVYFFYSTILCLPKFRIEFRWEINYNLIKENRSNPLTNPICTKKVHLGTRTTAAIQKKNQKNRPPLSAPARGYKLSKITIEKWQNRRDLYNKKSGSTRSKQITKEEKTRIVAFSINKMIFA